MIQFPETVWTKIQQASQMKTAAVHDIINGYRDPVRKFLMKRGISQLDAEDLVQEIFMVIFQQKLLEAADSKKGRFRSYLLGITKNVLSNWTRKKDAEKRGGGKDFVSLDQPLSAGGETIVADIINAPTKDDTFDPIWTEFIVQRAMEKLKTECERKQLAYYTVFSTYLQDVDATYESVAEKVGVNKNQVKLYIQRAKKKLLEYIKLEIASYCSSEEEYEEELSYLPRYFTKNR